MMDQNSLLRSKNVSVIIIITIIFFVLLCPCSSSILPFQKRQAEASSSLPVESVVRLDPKVTYDNILPPSNISAIAPNEEAGLQHPPVAAANKCLFYFSHVRNETASSYGVYVAEWLALRGHEFRDFVYFTNDYPWRQYNLTAGWKSGLSQGLVAECFLKAYSYTGNSTFVDLAKKSLLFLQVPIADGGVMIDEGNNRWWYEEYPRPAENVQPQILNGHQFVLLSLNEYLQQIDNNNDTSIIIRRLFDNGLNALKFDALMYDNGMNYSYYDRLRNPALKYHTTHIINFQRLYDITGDEEWLRIKKVFEE
jgi:hypothetical protein